MADDRLPIMGNFIGGGGGNDDNGSEHDTDSDIEAALDTSDEPDGENGDNAEEEEKHKITFNKNLPREHSYLGNDLEDVEGRTILDDDSLVSFPLMSLPGVVLLPGQLLPLNLFQSSAIALIKHVLERDKTFGLVTARLNFGGYSTDVANIGSTAEVLAMKEERDERSGLSRMRVKAIGRQRFQVVETRRQIDGILMANVRILPEQVLPNPLEGATPLSHLRLFHDVSLEQCDSLTTGEEDLKAYLSHWLKISRKPKVDRLSAANFTRWPPWVYRQYDAQYLMKEIEKELQSWNDTFEADRMPKEVCAFSFWVASVLPLSDADKLQFLTLNSAIQRLRYELNVMQRCTVLCCSHCSLPIANKRDVFSMSVEGPLGAYVNPGGYVHETLTVYKAQGLNLYGRPSEESSWFTGYAWTIAQCHRCDHHMGWKFTAAGNKQLKPDKFWGLCRSALSPNLMRDGEET